MTANIPEKKARQGGLGRPVLIVLVSALLLTIIAWGIAELYGEQAKTPATREDGGSVPPSTLDPAASPNPAESDPVKSKTDNVNGEPVDQNPKVDKNPTPQSSTGGDQQSTQPSQPASP